MTRAGYAEVVQVLAEQLQPQQSAGERGTVDQVVPFVADLKGDLVKMAVGGEQQARAVSTQWLLKESLTSQFRLYSSVVHHNREASLEVLTAIVINGSPAAVEVAVKACAGIVAGDEVLLPHRAFLEMYPPELQKASEDMQIAVSTSCIYDKWYYSLGIMPTDQVIV